MGRSAASAGLRVCGVFAVARSRLAPLLQGAVEASYLPVGAARAATANQQPTAPLTPRNRNRNAGRPIHGVEPVVHSRPSPKLDLTIMGTPNLPGIESPGNPHERPAPRRPPPATPASARRRNDLQL